MKIIFEKEQDGSYSAIVQSVKYKGRVRDELLYATIRVPSSEYPNAKHRVTWEDEWNLKLLRAFDTLEEAKTHVLENYKDHEPVILGPSWDE